MQHEEELKKLFDDLTWKIGCNSGVISFENFKKAINQKMVEAYEHGKNQIMSAVNQRLSA